jgi:acyl-[acyl carrier protein]--UDP-N-acetylglucosamine O-acyltransferase
MIGKATMI